MTKWIRIGVLTAFVAALVVAPVATHAQRPGQATRHAAKAVVGGRRGRPRKFGRPSRAVTLTLPEDVVAALQSIDVDLSRAVVRAAQPYVLQAPQPRAELTTFGNRAVIVVTHNLRLKERTGVELVPLSDGRALISFDEELSIAEIELRLRDALADPTFEHDDRSVFEALADILSSARRTDGVSLRRRSIIVLQGVNPAARDSDAGAFDQNFA